MTLCVVLHWVSKIELGFDISGFSFQINLSSNSQLLKNDISGNLITIMHVIHHMEYYQN